MPEDSSVWFFLFGLALLVDVVMSIGFLVVLRSIFHVSEEDLEEMSSWDEE